MSYFDATGAPGESRQEIAAVLLRDSDGAIVEAWTGFRVDWTMARGYPGAFGRSVNSPWIWLGMCALFPLPFLRRPLRLLHVDLVALLSLSVSYALFTRWKGRGLGAPRRAAPGLPAGEDARAGVEARHGPRSRTGRRLALTLSTRALGVGVLLLIAFRLILNVTTSTVIDVGYEAARSRWRAWRSSRRSPWDSWWRLIRVAWSPEPSPACRRLHPACGEPPRPRSPSRRLRPSSCFRCCFSTGRPAC